MNYIWQHKEAFFGTAVFIIAVMLFLLLCGLKEPDPPYVEECILLDFSTPTTETTLLEQTGGGGNPDAGASNAIPQDNHNTSTQNSNSNSISNQGFETQASEDAPTLQSGNEPSSETPSPTPTPAPTSKTEGRINFGGIVGGTGSGTSGSGTGSGNPGLGGGTGSGSGTGSGPGGSGGSIGNRKVTKIDPVGKDNMTGTVKLKILVNENGVVESVTVVSTDCTECTKPAIEAVKKWKYEAKPGSGTQTGIVTVEFKLR
ncbi:MAG: TonB family protein [Bacteroidales bacterium]|nr:TonB family protein [Bacteroidales bacterium]